MAGISLDVQHQGLEALARLLKAEEDGRQLRRELAADLRKEIEPAVAQARSAAMTIPGSGGTQPALRPQIASRIRPEVKLGGRWTGVRVKARRTPHVRGFTHAPKRTQRGGWRRQVFGKAWVTQIGRPGWFDDAMKPRADEYRAACLEVMERFARRLAERADGLGGDGG